MMRIVFFLVVIKNGRTSISNSTHFSRLYVDCTFHRSFMCVCVCVLGMCGVSIIERSFDGHFQIPNCQIINIR